MSLTGVLLAWRREMVRFADGEFRRLSTTSAQARILPEGLLGMERWWRPADPPEAVSAEFGRVAVVYVSPVTGDVLGDGSTTVRRFFRVTED